MKLRGTLLAFWGITIIFVFTTFAQSNQEPTVVIDSDALTISDLGSVSSETFRGTPFSVTVYNGMARYLFGGET